MPASPPPRIPTPSTGATSPPGRRACRSPSISPPTAATTAIIRACAGDVGMAGVAIDSIYDMRTLFAGIPLDQMTVSMTMNGAVLPVLALYIVAAEEQGVPPEKLAGTIQNDILKEFMVRNTYIYPPGAVAAHHLRHLRLHRGAHAEVQLDLDLRLPHAGGGRDAGPRARLHAGRRRRIRARRPRRRARHRPLRAAALVLLGDRHELLHGGRQAARRAPAVGEADEAVRAEGSRARCRCAPIARPRAGRSPRRTCSTTSSAPASRRWRRRRAHTQSLHTNALDEALALPTDFSARIARNTQIVLQQESGTTRIIDPWGGSFYVERLTYELAEAAWATSRRSRSWAAWPRRSRPALPKLRIEEAAARTQARIDAGRAGGDRRQQVPARATKRRSTCSRSTTRAVRQLQIDKLARLKRERDPQGGRRGARRAHPHRRRRQRQPAGARGRRRARQGDGRRDLGGAGAGLRPPSRGDQGDLRRLQAGGRHVRRRRARAEARRRVRGRTKAAGRASWSPRSARTATTAARR